MAERTKIYTLGGNEFYLAWFGSGIITVQQHVMGSGFSDTYQSFEPRQTIYLVYDADENECVYKLNGRTFYLLEAVISVACHKLVDAHLDRQRERERFAAKSKRVRNWFDKPAPKAD